MILKIISTIFYTVFVVFLVGTAGLLAGSMLPIPGNIELKIVKSGSMEPNIPTGSLVIVKPEQSYGIGDVITFGKDTKTDVPTTHRIISYVADEGGATAFQVKGDANEDADPNPVHRQEVIGKVVAHVPAVGYVLAFARTKLGFALLIGVPAALIILEEVVTIFREVAAAMRKRRRKDRGDHDADRGGSISDNSPMRLVYLRKRAMDEIFVPMFIEPRFFHKEWWQNNMRMHKDAYGTATFVVLGMIFTSTLLAGGAGGTLSYFNDLERSVNNVLRAGQGWEVEEDIIQTDTAALRSFSAETPEGEVLGTSDESTTTEPPVEESVSPETPAAQTAPNEPTLPVEELGAPVEAPEGQTAPSDPPSGSEPQPESPPIDQE